MITFNPVIKILGSIDRPSIRELREEQKHMLHSASIDYAIDNGGVLCNSVLNKLLPILDKEFGFGLMDDSGEVDWGHEESIGYKYKKYYPVIDTKVIMLMPGMYPCIPGWHCDSVPRSGVNGQPDLTKMDENQFHFICTASNIDNGSKTRFISESVYTPNYTEKVWKNVSEEITNCFVDTEENKNCQIIMFNTPTLHRCTPATEREFRFFFRLSMYNKPPENKIRHQVQVYTTENGGW